jgi:endonuclease/exonuclease/phosphatase family metal-dependent hydrolase
MKILKRVIYSILGLIGIFLLYVIIAIAHGTATDFQPEQLIDLEIKGTANSDTVNKDTLTFAIWNVGYGGLGAESNFFYDSGKMLTSGDKMVRGTEEMINKNIAGAAKVLTENPVDFYLLQEVDAGSKRSYYNNQYEKYAETLKGYASTYATNYNVTRVPLPVAEPFNVMGRIKSGLATYSKFQPHSPQRHQLPGGYEWPNNIFHLDRCMAVHRYHVKNGKELIVVNSHNSAYDEGGILKKQEMDYLKALIVEEYEKGNYVIVGADWNQCPPDFKPNTFRPEITPDSYYQINIAPDFLPEGWTWAYDGNTPTNRKLTESYRGQEKETFVTLIDFFLTSPNVEVLNTQGVDVDFEYSDHQPVQMKIALK